MTDWIRTAFGDALYGKHAHYDVLKALRGTTAEDAQKRPVENDKSIWDHLYHIVFWHDITMQVIEDKEIDWKAIQGTDWPSDDANLTEKGWKDLVASFENHVAQLKRIAEKADLNKLLKGFGNTPLGRGIIIEFQHNSYHIGQIVLLRKISGIWPPPEDKKT
ncbi:DinB family protein [Candidatus Bathyarchaeota archaeon]|nr:DinB family protein [Candidatus Bathyarchaeota archaeon]